jgi:hypothetical protein
MMSRRRNERLGTSGSVLFAGAFLPSFSARENNKNKNNNKKKIKKCETWMENDERRGKRRRRRAAPRSRLSSFFSSLSFVVVVARVFWRQKKKLVLLQTFHQNPKHKNSKKIAHRQQRHTLRARFAAHRKTHDARDDDNQSINR